MANLSEHTSHDMGMHTEQLEGRTQQRFFSATEDEHFAQPYTYDVDLSKEAEFDAQKMTQQEINSRLRELMKAGYGSITVRNPGAKHSVAVGILNRLNLHLDGSLGYKDPQ